MSTLEPLAFFTSVLVGSILGMSLAFFLRKAYNTFSDYAQERRLSRESAKVKARTEARIIEARVIETNSVQIIRALKSDDILLKWTFMNCAMKERKIEAIAQELAIETYNCVMVKKNLEYWMNTRTKV